MKNTVLIALIIILLIIICLGISPSGVQAIKISPLQHQISDQIKIGDSYDTVSNLLLDNLDFDCIDPWSNPHGKMQTITAIKHDFTTSVDFHKGPVSYDMVIKSRFDKNKKLLSHKTYCQAHFYSFHKALGLEH